MAKILLVEDDQNLVYMVRSFLLFEKYDVDIVEDGSHALAQLKSFEYDVVVLDWQLPSMSGLDICKEYRATGGRAPILMLTGKDKVQDKLEGLDSGADDYLTKPFDMKELGARIRALLRRSPTVREDVLKAGNLRLDPSKHCVFVDDKAVELVPREFQVLEFLMRHPNQVFAAEALLNRVWPSESDATTEALRSAMKRMRKKVDPDGKIIRNVHGVGYILESTESQ